MGFVTINGELVHTSFLNPNPVVNIVDGVSWESGGVEYKLLHYYHQNGEVETVMQSTNCSNNDGVFYIQP